MDGNNFKIINEKQENNKKNSKNISITTKLSRINGHIIVKLILIFCLIIIYPIVNKIVSSEYLTQ